MQVLGFSEKQVSLRMDHSEGALTEILELL